jgi:uncharacterized protein YecE (DUF72 family)
MKFGKLESLARVDFRMPADHPQTAQVLSVSGTLGPPAIYVGATGWGNPEWNGTWYPAKTKAADFLLHYAKQFGTIEFNTTHYRIPDAEQIAKWAEAAAPGFKFCPKVPQQISHYARLKADDATSEFCAAVAGLESFLGPTFLQLPDHHGPEAAASVLQFARTWPQELPLHWEFRHPDWFRGHAQAEAVFRELQRLGQGTVITDVAGRRDVLHMRLTNPVLVLRFVGNHPHATDYARTLDWVQRIRAWSQAGLREAYIFIHQPEMEEVPPFCAHWSELLAGATHADIRQPKPWTPPPPIQQSLF